MKKLLISIVAVAFIVPSVTLASIDANLKYGSRGMEVTELQEFLIDKGFLTGQTSGNFFALTRKAVIAWQASIGLPATGFVGSMSRAKINEDLSAANASAVSAEVAETGTTALTQTQTTSSAVSFASGCTSSKGFSTTTGKPCSASVTVQNTIANKTVTFPNGSIAEINEKGDIVRWIKEAQAVAQSSNNSTVQQQISQIQNSLNQIVQNTTSNGASSPSATPNIHVFSINDGAVLTSCKAKEDGSLLCTTELTLKYQTGKDINSLTRPKGVSVNMSVPSLGINQTAITDDGNYGGDSRIYSIFKIPITKDGIYPLTFFANGASYNYSLVIDYVDRYKNIQCTENGTFCNLSDIAYTNMTPHIVKVSENKELQSGMTGQVIGEFKLEGIANSIVNMLKFEATSIPLVFTAGYNRSANAGVNTTGATFVEPLLLSLGSNKITIKSQDMLKPGTYTITVKDIEAYGNDSGLKKIFVGPPITFTFEVKNKISYSIQNIVPAIGGNQIIHAGGVSIYYLINNGTDSPITVGKIKARVTTQDSRVFDAETSGTANVVIAPLSSNQAAVVSFLNPYETVTGPLKIETISIETNSMIPISGDLVIFKSIP